MTTDDGYPDLYPGELDAIEAEDRGDFPCCPPARELPLEGLVLQVVNFEAGYVDGNRRATSDIEAATAITSMVADPEAPADHPHQLLENTHKIVLDLDVPARLIPSSTPATPTSTST